LINLVVDSDLNGAIFADEVEKLLEKGQKLKVKKVGLRHQGRSKAWRRPGKILFLRLNWLLSQRSALVLSHLQIHPLFFTNYYYQTASLSSFHQYRLCFGSKHLDGAHLLKPASQLFGLGLIISL